MHRQYLQNQHGQLLALGISQPDRRATTPCPFSLCLLGFLSLASGHLLQPFTLQMRAETQKKQIRKVKFPGTGTSGSHFTCGIQTSQPLVWVPTAHPAQHSLGSCSPGLLLPVSPYLHIPQGCWVLWPLLFPFIKESAFPSQRSFVLKLHCRNTLQLPFQSLCSPASLQFPWKSSFSLWTSFRFKHFLSTDLVSKESFNLESE